MKPRDKESSHLLAYSSNGHNSQDWTRLTLGATNSIQVSHKDDRELMTSGSTSVLGWEAGTPM